MKYYKDKDMGDVYAYDDEQLAQVARLNELERLIEQTEPDFLAAKDGLQVALEDLNQAKGDGESDLDIEEKELTYKSALDEFNLIDSEYTPLKDEYDAISSVFFDIRDNINSMHEMTAKEIDAHLNPPISKEQHIAEAEAKKQSLLAEATDAIAPLQDAVDLDMATDEEVESLKEWKKYRVLLNRVNTSTAPDVDWPVKP
ncbi:tail fiber assembly protein [Morganella morganii]|uniref:tail fiber assembly protein n=1 Tax=Morganella morganii TaxID=582 RepID=UPI0034E5293D